MYQKVIIIIILGSCKRYAGQEKGYIEVPCPFVVLNYNRSMGGVDLGNQTHKAYRIRIRHKKWYWPLYTWFLNMQMVQAWRLFRATVRTHHQQAAEMQGALEESEAEFEKRMEGRPSMEVIKQRRDRREKEKVKENEDRKQKKEEKKLEEMPLLEFVRQCVEVTLVKHSDVNKNLPGSRLQDCRPALVRCCSMTTAAPTSSTSPPSRAAATTATTGATIGP